MKNNKSNLFRKNLFLALLLTPSITFATSITSSEAIINFKDWLASSVASRQPLHTLDFSKVPLTLAETDSASKMLYASSLQDVRDSLTASWTAQSFTHNNYTMKLGIFKMGINPPDGRSLYISMHGGGGAPKAVNDQQWENQKSLRFQYNPENAIWIAPRAPTDTWNMWHQSYMDGFLDKIIAAAIAIEGVNPNKIYIMGYSAGGDGTYNLAPRLADHWAGAAMAAGHPGDAQILNLRNLPFAIHVGEQDIAYNRSSLGIQWAKTLDSLEQNEPGTYPHSSGFPLTGHWMNSEDTVSIDYIKQFTRNPNPSKVTWFLDDVLRNRFYWLGLPSGSGVPYTSASAKINQQTVTIENSDSDTLILWLNDKLLDLDKPVTIIRDGKVVFNNTIIRTIGNLILSSSGGPDNSYHSPTRIETHANGSVIADTLVSEPTTSLKTHFQKLTPSGLSITVPQTGIYSIQFFALDGSLLKSYNQRFDKHSNFIQWPSKIPHTKSIYIDVKKTNYSSWRKK